ncbi:MAG TPA: hypothetical protein VMY37_33265 [Thermoguttaceae bacterium]|nr:hypothetical protein [Thermoguttaceae bacterium]
MAPLCPAGWSAQIHLGPLALDPDERVNLLPELTSPYQGTLNLLQSEQPAPRQLANRAPVGENRHPEAVHVRYSES